MPGLYLSRASETRRAGPSTGQGFPFEGIALDVGLVVLWELLGPSLSSVMSAHPGKAIVLVSALQCVVVGRALGIMMKVHGELAKLSLPQRLGALVCALAAGGFMWVLALVLVGSLPFPKACAALPIPILFASIMMAGYTLQHGGERTLRARWIDAVLAVVYLGTTEALILAATGDPSTRVPMVFFMALSYFPVRALIAFVPPATRYELVSASLASAWIVHDILS